MYPIADIAASKPRSTSACLKSPESTPKKVAMAPDTPMSVFSESVRSRIASVSSGSGYGHASREQDFDGIVSQKAVFFNEETIHTSEFPWRKWHIFVLASLGVHGTLPGSGSPAISNIDGSALHARHQALLGLLGFFLTLWTCSEGAIRVSPASKATFRAVLALMSKSSRRSWL